MTSSTEVTKPSPSKKQKTIIRLTRIKQWYIVADVDTYKTLKGIGAPMLRVHQNFLPTLQLLTKSKNINAVGVDFESEILDPFLEKTASTWNRKYGKCTVTSKVMIFQAADGKVELAEKAIPVLEGRLRTFFERWGYKCAIQYSKNRTGTRIKLHVEYWFDSEKMPVLPLETPVEETPKVQFRLGFTRLTFSFDQFQSKTELQAPLPGSQERSRAHKTGKVHLLVEVSQGGVFKPLHSTSCLYSQLSSVKPLITALMNVLSMDQHNLDNEAE